MVPLFFLFTQKNKQMKKACGQEAFGKYFTSRTGWTGKNNVWAENDGVMSMRIGKNFPKNQIVH